MPWQQTVSQLEWEKWARDLRAGDRPKGRNASPPNGSAFAAPHRVPTSYAELHRNATLFREEERELSAAFSYGRGGSPSSWDPPPPPRPAAPGGFRTPEAAPPGHAPPGDGYAASPSIALIRAAAAAYAAQQDAPPQHARAPLPGGPPSAQSPRLTALQLIRLTSDKLLGALPDSPNDSAAVQQWKAAHVVAHSRPTPLPSPALPAHSKATQDSLSKELVRSPPADSPRQRRPSRPAPPSMCCRLRPHPTRRAAPSAGGAA